MSFQRIKIYLFLLALGLVLFILFSNLYILSFGTGKIYSSLADIPPQSVALVFGGGMKKDGVTMSEMQTDRVTQAVNLYKAGKVQKILVTGDNGANNVNEVDAMHAFAVASGVPDQAVDIDPHGYNTFKSCQRAKTVYGVTTSITISQNFHLPRILYFCSQQGIQVTGLTADWRDYGFWESLWPQHIREWLARVKAVISGKSDVVGNVVVY